MCGGLGPLGARGAGGFDGVADVLAVAERGLADELALAVVDREAVAGVGTRLLAADVLLHGAVDADASVAVMISDLCSLFSCLLKDLGLLGSVCPGRNDVLEHALFAALASIAGFTIATEAAGGVEEVRRVDPDNAGLHLRSDVERDIDALAPYAGCETVGGVVGEFDGFGRCAEGHRGEDGAEDLLLRDR